MTPNEKDWEEEFLNEYCEERFANSGIGYLAVKVDPERIISFIRSNFISREELERVIEEMTTTFRKDFSLLNSCEPHKVYNQALQDIKSKFLNNHEAKKNN